MRYLITGDREWTDFDKMFRVLSALWTVAPDTIIVEGEARGADIMSRTIWEEFGGTVDKHPADWKTYRRAAGPIRNQFMIDESRRRATVDGHVLKGAAAFHHDLTKSKGTRDMVERLKKAIGEDRILFVR